MYNYVILYNHKNITMKINTYIEELQELARGNLKICRMNWWLLKYENEFITAINSSTCNKWKKWYYDGEIPSTCLCPKKNNMCVFIDLYRELDRYTQIQKLEKYFKKCFVSFQGIKESKYLIDNWMIDIRPIITSIYLTLDFQDNLKIRFFNSDPIFELKINKDDYKYTLLCMDIFNYNMYIKG